MRKSIFILSTCLVTTFLNAQVTLDYTYSFHGNGTGKVVFYWPYDNNNGNGMQIGGASYSNFNTTTYGNILAFYDSNVYKILDLDTYTLFDRMTFENSSDKYYEIRLTAKGYFTNDDRICYAVVEVDRQKYGSEYHHLYIYDSEKNLIQDLGTSNYISACMIPLHDGTYKLGVARYYNYNYTIEIYSLPGNGDISTDIPAPSSPKRSARKMARDGQVVVETENNIYTLTGTEIK